MQAFTEYDSPLGRLLLAAKDDFLTGVWFQGQNHFASSLTAAAENQETSVLQDAKHWLDLYFNRRKPDFLPPLLPEGTTFQQEVWEILRRIPYGQTITYGEIAAELAANRGLPRMSSQAVGNAVGRNPISIFIPCHRVVGKNGSLTGYAGGLDRKAALLQSEGVLRK